MDFIRSFFDYVTRKLFGRGRKSSTSNTATPSTPTPTKPAPKLDPAWDIFIWRYSPISSKHKLPLYDQFPIGLMVQTSRGANGRTIHECCNFHWLDSAALLQVLKLRQSALASFSQTSKLRYLEQIIQLCLSSSNPAYRKYVSSQIKDWRRLTEEETTELFEWVNTYHRARIVPNRNP